MPHTRKHARRLLSELLPFLPGGAERVLESPSYFDPGFYELFCELTEDLIFHEPQAGLKVVPVLPRLAAGMPEGDTPESRREYLERQVRAYALWGSAYRVAGQPDAAERLFREAFRLGRARRVSRTSRADLYWRLALLRACQKRFEGAFRLAELSSRLFQADRNASGRGVALATRGTVCSLARRFSEAVAILSEVLGSHKLNPRTEYSATHNLAYAVSQARDPDLDSALRHLRRARQLLGPRGSVQKAKLYWIEGMIFLRRGSADAERGERRYLKALQGFLKYQAPYEIALVSLDLSALFRFQKRWPELDKLAADTYRRFRELHEDLEALAALKLWRDSVQMRTLTEEIISEAKATLEERPRGRGLTTSASASAGRHPARR